MSVKISIRGETDSTLEINSSDVLRTLEEDITGISLRSGDLLHAKFRFPRCQHGCGLTILKAEEAYGAVCLEHPEESPIPIERDDLSRYKLSIDKLLFEIRSANRIEGDLDRIKGGFTR